MDVNPEPPVPSQPEAQNTTPEVPKQLEPPASRLHGIFMGPQRLRAGWRIVLFVLIVAAFLTVINVIASRIAKPGPPSFTPRKMLLSEIVAFAVIAIATAIMAKIDRLPFGTYGLPGRNAFKSRFWEGGLWGFLALSAVLGIMRMAGAFSFGPVVQSLPEALKYGALWAAVFVMVGLFEETALRGYLLRALTDGISFWPAAIITSALFVLGHSRNPGESWMGVLATGWVGLLFCFMLRRTGDLWMAVGFHFTWDWAETFFYGVPDSGLVAPGHLRNPAFAGPRWLSGGSVGPEGSIVAFLVIGILFVLVHLRFREAKYPQAELASAAVPAQDAA